MSAASEKTDEKSEFESHIEDSEMNSRIQFSRIWNDFMNDIAEVFPEHAARVNAFKLTPLTDPKSTDAVIQYFVAQIRPHSEKLMKQDESLFRDKRITLFPGFTYTKIWTRDISENTKKTIWKYVSALYFLSSFNDDSSKLMIRSLFEIFSRELQSPDLSTKLGENAGVFNKIFSVFSKTLGIDLPIPPAAAAAGAESGGSAAATEGESGVAASSGETPTDGDASAGASGTSEGEFDFSAGEELLNKFRNSEMGKMAMEIMQELDISELARDFSDTDLESSPLDIIQKLFTNSAGKIFGLFNVMKTKLTEKLTSGKFNQAKFAEEAKDMMKDLEKLGMSGGIPGMSNIMESIDNMMKGNAGEKGSMMSNILSSLTGIGGAKASERLQHEMEHNPFMKRMRERERLQAELQRRRAAAAMLAAAVEKEQAAAAAAAVGQNKNKQNKKK